MTPEDPKRPPEYGGIEPVPTYAGGPTSADQQPEPDEFEEQSDEKKNEDYRKLYERMEYLIDEVEENREEANRWRTRSWIWRISSFVAGNVAGFLIAVLLG